MLNNKSYVTKSCKEYRLRRRLKHTSFNNHSTVRKTELRVRPHFTLQQAITDELFECV